MTLTGRQHGDLATYAVDADLRHLLAAAVSHGRTRSSTDLTANERGRLMRAARDLSARDIELVLTATATPPVIRPTTRTAMTDTARTDERTTA